MVNAGIITLDQGDALIANLNLALKEIEKGQTQEAINVLLTFIYKVKDLMNDGDIPAEQATAIIDATYAIIDQLIIDIGDLIIIIQDMVNAGIINAGQGNALITKLNQALNKLEKGQTKVAINNLNAFINQVTGLMYGGKIPEEQANAMIEATYAIIEELDYTSKKDSKSKKDPKSKKSYTLNSELLDMEESNETILGKIYPHTCHPIQLYIGPTSFFCQQD